MLSSRARQELKTLGCGKGWLELRCEGRRYSVTRTDTDKARGSWEVAIYDNDKHAWALSTGQTPEGAFATRTAAVAALRRWIDAHPVPSSMGPNVDWLSRVDR